MDQKSILESLAVNETTLISLCRDGIRTCDEYYQSLEIADLLMRIDEPTVAQRLYLESLVLTVGDYEEKHYPMGN